MAKKLTAIVTTREPGSTGRASPFGALALCGSALVTRSVVTRSLVTRSLVAGFLVAFAPTLVSAGSAGEADYTALDLLSPCQEADNDARWGQAAETECEQYLMGFVDALKVNGLAGPGTAVCPPPVNTADEVRWAFMRWVHRDYSSRKRMPAGEALMATLKESFPCAD